MIEKCCWNCVNEHPCDWSKAGGRKYCEDWIYEKWDELEVEDWRSDECGDKECPYYCASERCAAAAGCAVFIKKEQEEKNIEACKSGETGEKKV